MDSGKKKKTRCLLNPNQAAEYLRWLADQVEREAVELAEADEGLDWLIRIKESISPGTGKSSHRIKIKFSVPVPDGAEPSARSEAEEPVQDPSPGETDGLRRDQSFSRLKKDMAAEFSRLKKSLKGGRLPQSGDVVAFCRLCLEMITHPGRGEEHYPELEAAARELVTASEADDAHRLAEALEKLGKLKSACHKRYK